MHSACASSNTAIIDAFNYIRLGKAEIIIVGDQKPPLLKVVLWIQWLRHYLHNENPQQASRPFDIKRWFCYGRRCGRTCYGKFGVCLARGANIIAEMAGAEWLTRII
jgi:3-oxoacyl-[acyl-carrier-protein] synthase II